MKLAIRRIFKRYMIFKKFIGDGSRSVIPAVLTYLVFHSSFASYFIDYIIKFLKFMGDNLTCLMIRDFFCGDTLMLPCLRKIYAHFEKFLHLKIEWFINRFVLHILTNPYSGNWSILFCLKNVNVV